MSEEPEAMEIPMRCDGTPKTFFYHPDYPGHIMYNRSDGVIQPICIAHGHD